MRRKNNNFNKSRNRGEVTVSSQREAEERALHNKRAAAFRAYKEKKKKKKGRRIKRSPTVHIFRRYFWPPVNGESISAAAWRPNPALPATHRDGWGHGGQDRKKRRRKKKDWEGEKKKGIKEDTAEWKRPIALCSDEA